MKILINNFLGTRPRVNPELLPDNVGQIANNCNLVHGSLSAFGKANAIYELSLTGIHKTIHMYRKGDGTKLWLEWTDEVDVQPGPIAGDTTKRAYFTGTDFPRVFDDTLVDAGAGAYPQSSYILGITPPATAPTVALGAGGSGSARDLTYVYTFVRKWASGAVDESAPSPASAIVNALPGQIVTVNNFAATPANRGVTHRRIYRASTGGFQFVTEIAVATTTHDDSILDSALGEELLTEGWDEPPEDMKGLIALPNGCFAGFSKNNVCFSVPYQVHAYPEDNCYTLPYDVVGLGFIGTMVVAMTEGFAYLLDGNDPAFMSVQRIPNLYPCLSKRGIVSTEAGVIYPTFDGMVVVRPGGAAELLTQNLASRDDWDSFYPASIKAVNYRSHYFASYSANYVDPAVAEEANQAALASNFSGAIGGSAVNVVELNGDTFIETSDPGEIGTNGFMLEYGIPQNGFIGLFSGIQALFVDVMGGELYYVATNPSDGSNYVYQWDEQVAREPYLWRSKKFVLRQESNFSAARILARWEDALSQEEADEYNAMRAAAIAANQAALATNTSGGLNGSAINVVEINGDSLQDVPPLLDDIVGLTMKIYYNDKLKFTRTVDSDKPFRLPSGYRGKFVEVELNGQIEVEEFRMATSMLDLYA